MRLSVKGSTPWQHLGIEVGNHANTPQFAAVSIARWWQSAQRDNVDAQRLLILADGGESNSARRRAAWKAFIQACLADRYRNRVNFCHYPPGTSKWNPIEYRLFSEIGKNWSVQQLLQDAKNSEDYGFSNSHWTVFALKHIRL